MQSWQGWPLERLIYLFLGAAFLLVWIQVTLFHWKGAFRSKFMWGPVVYTPLLILTAFAFAASRSQMLGQIFVLAYVIGALEGLLGTALHLNGVRQMVGGFNLRNFIAGPPAVLAFVYAALCLFGLLSYYWPQIAAA